LGEFRIIIIEEYDKYLEENLCKSTHKFSGSTIFEEWWIRT
jgi:hypothetical protein